MTELDDASVALDAVLGSDAEDAARLAFFERLADTQLNLALEAEPAADSDAISPRLFDVDGTRFALVFDRPSRLTDFAEGAAPYAELSGRVLAEMLAGQGLGLALNPGTSPGARLILPAELDWLAEHLSPMPDASESRIRELAPPPALPEALIAALDRKFATAAGRARHAWLAEAVHDNGARTALLVFIDPITGAEGALVRLVQEALTFSGLEAGAIDVGFAPASAPLAGRIAKVGLRFDLPDATSDAEIPAPGSDPSKPPILR